MSSNGGASMVVTSQTSAVQQQAMAAQLAYNMQNNLPVTLTAQPGDPGANAIADSVYAQAQTLALTPQTPTIGTQVGASTTGSNPAAPSTGATAPAWEQWLWAHVPNLSGGGGASSVAAGPAEQAAAAGASTPATAAAGGGYTTGATNFGPTSTQSAAGWLQSHMANYGLVILGGLLVLGALLISQRKNIETVVTSAGKVAALA